AAQPAGSSESKPWWHRAKEWVSSPVGYGTILGGIIGSMVGGFLGGPTGLVGGMAVGATIGAMWGSAQEGYLRTASELIQGNPWLSHRPTDFPSDPSAATDWLLHTMQSNAQGPIAETLRQTHQKMGPLGRLVTVPIWIGLVKGDGPWDFKPEQKKWGWNNLTGPMELAGLQVRRDAFSNIHYGYVGRSLGYSRWFLELGAGIAQIQAGDSRWVYWKTWFDDPVDNAAIRAGMDLYDQYIAHGKQLDENALQEALLQHPDVLCTPECKKP
ncbi:MAG: polymorphic toxin type 44 domain-containing protein, partial [Anaerolineales bacterium]